MLPLPFALPSPAHFLQAMRRHDHILKKDLTAGFLHCVLHEESRRFTGFRDPRTGELIYFDYGNKPPYMTYGVANAKGEMVHEVPIDLPGPRLPHDMGLTPNYSILHDLPFFQDEKTFQETKKRRLASTMTYRRALA